MKIRLNSDSRIALKRAAKEFVERLHPESKLDAAYNKVRDGVMKLFEAEYPAKDMAVLSRYQCGETVQDVRLRVTEGGFVTFRLRPSDHRMAPHWTPTFEVDEKLSRAFYAYDKALNVRSAAIKERLKDYNALIDFARNWEDVIEIWPEAAKHLAAYRPDAITALTAVGPQVIGRIRHDVKMAQAAAA